MYIPYLLQLFINNIKQGEKMKTFSTFLTETINEKELSPLQKEYQEYFQTALKDAGVESPAELDEEAMKKFFDGITAGWIKGKGKK
jgi:hypothetical protein